MLAEIKGEPGYTFNPYGFITDEAGAIINGIRDVYGEAGVLKTFTCQFQFRQGVERQLRRMPNGLDDLKQEFEMLAMQMSSIYHRHIEHFFTFSCWKYCFQFDR